MRRAVLIGKLQDDPLADLVEAMAQALGVQHEIHRASVLQYRQASAHLEEQLRAALQEARQPLDPAALVRLEQAAVTGADRRAAQLARAHNRRTMLTAVTAVVAALLVTGAAAIGGGTARKPQRSRPPRPGCRRHSATVRRLPRLGSP